MSSYDSSRSEFGATGLAGQIGNVFVAGFAPAATHSNLPTSGFFGRLGLAFSAFGERLSAWNDARLTRQSLEALSDRELDDIGLCRGDISRISRAR